MAITQRVAEREQERLMTGEKRENGRVVTLRLIIMLKKCEHVSNASPG
jgi:hypothetical protein